MRMGGEHMMKAYRSRLWSLRVVLNGGMGTKEADQ